MSVFLGSSVNDKFKIYLRFSLYPEPTTNHFTNWDGFRHIVLRFRKSIGSSLVVTQDEILNRWKENCSLDSNRQLPILNKVDNGLGGDDNQINKQIRIINPDTESGEYYIGHKKEIRMEVIDSLNGERWSLEEVEDILNAFVKTSKTYYTSSNGCTGQIILNTRI